MVDAARLRSDFPVLSRTFPNGPLVYLDSACTSLKPRPVIDAVARYYTDRPVCGGRSVHRLGHEVTQSVDAARTALAGFLHASGPDDVVFTANATHAINMVASGVRWKRGDVVITSDKEHNSNWLPWLRLRELVGIDVRTVPSRADGSFDLAAYEAAVRKAGASLRLVAVAHVSNADGVTVPIREVAERAHAAGAKVLVDGAQSAGHREVDLRRLGADWFAVSLHKMMGPSGLGALVGTPESLAALEPAVLGGGTVARSGVADYELLPAPQRLEPGLQNYGALAAVPAAVSYLRGIGLHDLVQHERSLNVHATQRLLEVGGVRVHGPSAEARGGIVPFTMEGIGPHDVALYLDESRNIAVRSGAHCANSYFESRGLDGWVRASFHAYTTRGDVDALVDGVARLAGSLRRPGQRS